MITATPEWLCPNDVPEWLLPRGPKRRSLMGDFKAKHFKAKQ
jgi:hypothetical protein